MISENDSSMIKSGTMPQLPEWESWTVEEASQHTGYNPEYIRRLIRTEEIEAVKIGRTWLINADSLREYMSQGDDVDDRRYGPKIK